jgi:cytochrome c oxidase subunit 2
LRRKLTSFVFAVLLALAAAGVAAAGNGGFAPVAPASPNATHIRSAYFLIFGFTTAIFILVESLLIVFVWKYRSRGRSRSVEGAQVHGHTRLELIWTGIPIVILAIIAGFVYYQLPNITSAPAAANPIHVTVEGHQFYWQFDYTDTPDKARSIGTLHVPAGAVVDLRVLSPDVIHSWWIPALGGKIQAIPGHPNTTWFQATRQGSFEGQCAELCGVFHASMHAVVQSQSHAAYEHYLATWKETIGKQIWNGVCATCHGNLGQGGYGPQIDNNSILIHPVALSGIVHNGITGSAGAMPPVGDTWSPEEFKALAAYVQKNIYKPSASGLTSGG